MVKTVTKARKAIVKAAQRGAEKLRIVAGEAAGAAAEAAAGVVLKSAASALERGRSGVVQSTPAVKKTLGRAAKREHLARRPVPPSQLHSSIPSVLSDIVVGTMIDLLAGRCKEMRR